MSGSVLDHSRIRNPTPLTVIAQRPLCPTSETMRDLSSTRLAAFVDVRGLFVPYIWRWWHLQDDMFRLMAPGLRACIHTYLIRPSVQHCLRYCPAHAGLVHVVVKGTPHSTLEAAHQERYDQSDQEERANDECGNGKANISVSDRAFIFVHTANAKAAWFVVGSNRVREGHGFEPSSSASNGEGDQVCPDKV